jgi:sec-independent protein translocase protein TatB
MNAETVSAKSPDTKFVVPIHRKPQWMGQPHSWRCKGGPRPPNIDLSIVCPAIVGSASPHYDESMSFSETIFLFFLALIVFGPKKLPEIARQAGKLLAELRRASNEFKSQIETEIAHLEVEKKQTILPPSEPPQGAVARLSLNPASEIAPHESQATLAAPVAEPAIPVASSPLANSPLANSEEASAGNSATENQATPTAPDSSAASLDLETAPAAQDSHV